MRKPFLLIICQLIGFAVLACVNEYHTDKYGNEHNVFTEALYFYSDHDEKAAHTFLAKFDLSKIETYSKEDQSDIAVKLLFLKKTDEALAILKRLQQQYPKEYTIAANLGTAYELVGENELALQFIKKGMELNHDSHQGTEWVHVKILEAKINIARDPSWLEKNRVLQTGVSFNSKPSAQLQEKIYAIEYQLKERIPFTPYPNPMIGNVFDELGDLYATQRSVELAYMAYDFAILYGVFNKEEVQQKSRELEPILRKQKIVFPSWKVRLRSHQQDNVIEDAASFAQEQLLDSSNRERNLKSIQSLTELFTKKEEEKKSDMPWYIAGGSILLVTSGLLLYRRKRKHSV